MLANRVLRLAESRFALIVLLAVGAVIFTWRLGSAPIAVSNDESHFSAHAYALATTGRDLNGARLPLFIEMIDPLVPDVPATAFWQPFLFYLTSISLVVFPLTEWSIRLPVVIVALASVALIYAIVLEVFGRRSVALAAAVLMAFTPALFVMGRQAIDYSCPVLFVLGWLWGLARYLRTGRPLALAAAGVTLGLAALSHISGWAIVPIYTVITIVTLLWHRLDVRPIVVFLAGLLIPIVLIASWLAFHPGVLHDLVARYGLVDDPRWAAQAAKTSQTLAQRVSLYWDYYSPSFLLFAGGSHPTQATSRVGVFLVPLGLLIPIGIGVARMARRPLTPAIMLGFLAAPLPVVLVLGSLGEYSIGRVMLLVPFGILVAAYGIDWLAGRGKRGRAALAIIAIALPLQYASFLQDYFNDYQLRAAARFDALNTRGVADFAIDYAQRSPVPRIYLSDDGSDSKALRWRFHLWKNRQYALWDKTRYFQSFSPGDDIPAGSLLVFFPSDARAKTLIATGQFTLLREITQPSGEPASIVLLRQ
jgi:4-amino-4-deoxy-L-arabinose transferase-like glycosyltransferase